MNTHPPGASDPGVLRLSTRSLGPMGAGSNMFRCGVAHSSGAVFLGTYGPQPGIIWRYDPPPPGAPDPVALTRIAAPGEYQLDCMIEAPNGRIYIGTAYNGTVYELDPATGAVRDLGAPPVDSTPWIFTMMRTRAGEIYGARGVGLFRLDWRTGAMESCGVVPGDHATPGVASAPITRTLEERPDGLIWGDTNRWVYTFDPRTGRIELVADVVAFDPACYGVMHGLGFSATNDLYFVVYARFNYRVAQHPLAVCRAETGKIEPVDIPGVDGRLWALGWERGALKPRWIISRYDDATQASSLLFLDVERRRIDERWEVPGRETPPTMTAGDRPWFYASAPGTLYRSDPAARRLEPAARNPVPVECRCLAASPAGVLGTDTYDCGFVFTFDPATGRSASHGRVYFDDHRANFGPAAFAGADGRYFLANHGENVEVAQLWSTDVRTDAHTRLGDSVVQLVRLTDGSVAGTTGVNPPSLVAGVEGSWTPAWTARPGRPFIYRPGAERVETLAGLERAGPLAELPGAGTGAGASGRLLAAVERELRVYDLSQRRVVWETRLDRPAIAAASDPARGRVLLVLEGELLAVFAGFAAGPALPDPAVLPFGPCGRGFFVLPKTGRAVGVSPDGLLTVVDPGRGERIQIHGPEPAHAGPAVHPIEDRWYFAYREVFEFCLEG